MHSKSQNLLTVLVDHLLKIRKGENTGDSRYINKNKLNKACFQHDMTYGDFKDLAKRKASDKVLIDKAFNIARNLKYDGYQKGVASMASKFFDKKPSGSAIKNKIKQSDQLAEEFQKPVA